MVWSEWSHGRLGPVTPLPPVDHELGDVSMTVIAYPRIEGRGGVESKPDSC